VRHVTLLETVEQYGGQVIEQVIDRWTAVVQHGLDRGTA